MSFAVLRSQLTSLDSNSGLLILPPPGNVIGDFLYAPHIWTEDEVKAWKGSKTPPATAETLPDSTEVLIHLVHFPQAHTLREIRVSPEDFKKIDRATGACVCTWIVAGESDVLLIPTAAIEFTEQQKADFREGKIKEDLSNAPLLSECLKK